MKSSASYCSKICREVICLSHHMEGTTEMVRPCYFDARPGGFLYQIWKTLPICETCGSRGPVCPVCAGGLETWDLSKYEDELDFKENDRVDVFVKVGIGRRDLDKIFGILLCCCQSRNWRGRARLILAVDRRRLRTRSGGEASNC